MPEIDDTRWLIRFAQRLSGNAEDGEDLAQDVIVAVADAPQELNRRFLAAVTRNLFRMRQRALGRRQRRELAYAAGLGELARPSESAIELASILRDILEELDDTTRSLLLARHLEGRTAEDIATRLGEPASTVRTRLARARKRLRDELDARWRGDRPWTAIAAVPSSWTSEAMPVASTVGGGAAFAWTGIASVAVAVGSAWALPDAQRTESATPPTATAAATAEPAEAAVAARVNPDPRRAAILLARARRLERESQARMPTPDIEEDDDFVEALEDAFLPLEPSERAMQACVDAAPAGASGVASIRAKVVGEPDVGAIVDSVEILDDASQPQLVDCLVEALFQADFPDPSDVAFDDYVFEADLDTRTMTSQAGIGAGRLLDLLAAFPELENEVATAIDADPTVAAELRKELAAEPERAADFAALQADR